MDLEPITATMPDLLPQDELWVFTDPKTGVISRSVPESKLKRIEYILVGICVLGFPIVALSTTTLLGACGVGGWAMLAALALEAVVVYPLLLKAIEQDAGAHQLEGRARNILSLKAYLRTHEVDSTETFTKLDSLAIEVAEASRKLETVTEELAKAKSALGDSEYLKPLEEQAATLTQTIDTAEILSHELTKATLELHYTKKSVLGSHYTPEPREITELTSAADFLAKTQAQLEAWQELGTPTPELEKEGRS